MPGTTRLARIARITAKIISGLVVFLFVTVIVLFVANSFDVPLSAQAKALLTPPPNPYRPDENIYLAMAGLDGPEERPIVKMGEQRIATYDKGLDAALLNPELALNLKKQWDDAKRKVDGKVDDLGNPRTGSIWKNAQTHRQEIATLLAANQELYKRYFSLHRLAGYYETARPSFMMPFIVPPQSLRTLLLADVANRIQTGNVEQQHDALNDLQQDMRLWRAMLKGDGTLISKMLSVAYLHSDMILIADLITDSSTDLKSLEDILDPILLPFNPQDFAIGNAFAAEFRASAPAYQTISAGNEMTYVAHLGGWSRLWNAFQAHFFKINATENTNAEIAARWVEVGNSPPSLFNQARQAQHEWLEKAQSHLAPNYVYNPIGKILISIAAQRYDDYSLRAYDVAAYQRLVYLVFQLKRQHIAAADVAAFMTAHPEWSKHPVDGKPFPWNAVSGEIYVNTLGLHAREQRFSIVVH